MIKNKQTILELSKILRMELLKANKSVAEHGASLDSPKTKEDYLRDCDITYSIMSIMDTLKEVDELIAFLDTPVSEKYKTYEEVAREQCDGDIRELSRHMRKAVVEVLLKDIADLF